MMKTTFKNTLAITLFLHLAAASTAYASEYSGHAHKEGEHDEAEETHERVQHGSHEHGLAVLNIAKTDQGLEIILESPAANVFGFEHKAHDKDQHEAVHLAKEKLEAGGTLFKPNNKAKCQFINVMIESDIVAKHEQEKHGDEHKDHDAHHDKHDHDNHEHKEQNHKDDDHASHEHEEKAGSHSDVEMVWAFTCKEPAALNSVETTLFSQFPKGFSKLNVEWITNESAGTVKLEADGAITLSQ